MQYTTYGYHQAVGELFKKCLEEGNRSLITLDKQVNDELITNTSAIPREMFAPSSDRVVYIHGK